MKTNVKGMASVSLMDDITIKLNQDPDAQTITGPGTLSAESKSCARMRNNTLPQEVYNENRNHL